MREMGDDCNVASRRNEDSTSSSSPKLGAAQRTKNLEESPNREDIPLEERDALPLARQSGEPDEGMHKITDNKCYVENIFTEHHEIGATEPLLFVPSGTQSLVQGFPYSETKLRPDAPPFTPESLTRSCPAACGISGIIDSVCGEPSYVPRGKLDESCFVNVDLRSPTENDATPVVPKGKQRLVAAPRTPQPLPVIRDLRDPIRDPGLKPFSLTSTPRLKRSPPKVEESLDPLHTNVDMNETVTASAESGANEPEISENLPESAESRVVHGHWRIFRTIFTVGNRIQIAVFIASIILCIIIVVYVFV